MPIRVKKHFRKTKKGLVTVKESNRKEKVKKALLISGGLLATAGTALLLKKRLGSVVGTAKKGAVTVSSKAGNVVPSLRGDVAASKAKDITELTPKKLASGKQYQTLTDPWLDASVTATEGKSVVTDTKQLLLPPAKYKTVDDPWNEVTDVVKERVSVSKLKEKPKLLTSGKNRPEYVTPTKASDVTGRGKTLKQEISSNRALVKREATDLKNANERLKLAEKYKASDSPATIRTGENYERAAKERLTVISKRSPSKTKAGLVTIRGKASKDSVRYPYTKKTKVTEVVKKKTGKSRRELLTGKSSQKIADNLIESTTKSAINKAGDTVMDAVIPNSSVYRRTFRDIKGRVKQVERLSNELEESGNKVQNRRRLLKNTFKKIVEESSLRPADAEKVAKGATNRTRLTIRKASSTGKANPEVSYTTDSRFPVQGGVRISKRVYRKPQGLLDKISQGLRKAARYKSGKYDTRYD